MKWLQVEKESCSFSPQGETTSLNYQIDPQRRAAEARLAGLLRITVLEKLYVLSRKLSIGRAEAILEIS
jgi:hypothetical protein